MRPTLVFPSREVSSCRPDLGTFAREVGPGSSRLLRHLRHLRPSTSHRVPCTNRVPELRFGPSDRSEVARGTPQLIVRFSGAALQRRRSFECGRGSRDFGPNSSSQAMWAGNAGYKVSRVCFRVARKVVLPGQLLSGRQAVLRGAGLLFLASEPAAARFASLSVINGAGCRGRAFRVSCTDCDGGSAGLFRLRHVAGVARAAAGGAAGSRLGQGIAHISFRTGRPRCPSSLACPCPLPPKKPWQSWPPAPPRWPRRPGGTCWSASPRSRTRGTRGGSGIPCRACWPCARRRCCAGTP